MSRYMQVFELAIDALQVSCEPYTVALCFPTSFHEQRPYTVALCLPTSFLYDLLVTLFYAYNGPGVHVRRVKLTITSA